MRNKNWLVWCLMGGLCLPVAAKDFRHKAGEPLRVQRFEQSEPVVRTALGLLGRDTRNVLGDTIVEVDGNAEIMLSIDPEYFERKGQKSFEAFHIAEQNGRLNITGSDAHGLAYGILEVSRMMGVSPWEWWADASPARQKELRVAKGFETTQAPSVQYRGIFINDEDWGLMPWSGTTYEPENGRGIVGPKTNARIFELLLRLRANYFWPAMHECTLPFFLTPGNREVAEQYGIYIGGSHCEPMASSAAGEWRRRGQGDYDYVHNSEAVRQFWLDRIRQVHSQPIVYTLGMRGVHDGKMQGAKSLNEQRETLQRIIGDQREMLSLEVESDVTRIPQVFIPYKEVLDIYNSGLQVPDDVCLMWCDDNFGYINHFPTADEQKRRGGNGLYYHVSYWGRPHDYLWLGTFHPKLLYQQMRLAYDHDIQRIWVLNVGDIKPAEYQIELFLDMAWDIDRVTRTGVDQHLTDFLTREFGKTGGELSAVMSQSYDLAFECKPEFLGHTRTEEKDPKYKIVSDMPWSAESINARLARYAAISDQAEQLEQKIPANRRDTYFQLVRYPVQAAAQMNRKMLIGQLARHGMGNWSESDAAMDSIRSLTELYNKGIRNNGKWQGIMDCQPRRLAVFMPLEHRTDTTAIPVEVKPLFRWKSQDLWTALDSERSFTFRLDSDADSVSIDISMLPTHPLDNKALRYEVTIDDGAAEVFAIQTKGRSEEWKQNVLTNTSLRTLTMRQTESGTHVLKLKPLDEGLFLKEISIKTSK